MKFTVEVIRRGRGNQARQRVDIITELQRSGQDSSEYQTSLTYKANLGGRNAERERETETDRKRERERERQRDRETERQRERIEK